jgi:hypothetical protein
VCNGRDEGNGRAVRMRHEEERIAGPCKHRFEEGGLVREPDPALGGQEGPLPAP